jgi:hypothetical protein
MARGMMGTTKVAKDTKIKSETGKKIGQKNKV